MDCTDATADVWCSLLPLAGQSRMMSRAQPVAQPGGSHHDSGDAIDVFAY